MGLKFLPNFELGFEESIREFRIDRVRDSESKSLERTYTSGGFSKNSPKMTQ